MLNNVSPFASFPINDYLTVVRKSASVNGNLPHFNVLQDKETQSISFGPNTTTPRLHCQCHTKEARIGLKPKGLGYLLILYASLKLFDWHVSHLTSLDLHFLSYMMRRNELNHCFQNWVPWTIGPLSCFIKKSILWSKALISTRGNLPLRGHLAMSGDILTVESGRGYCQCIY